MRGKRGTTTAALFPHQPTKILFDEGSVSAVVKKEGAWSLRPFDTDHLAHSQIRQKRTRSLFAYPAVDYSNKKRKTSRTTRKRLFAQQKECRNPLDAFLAIRPFALATAEVATKIGLVRALQWAFLSSKAPGLKSSLGAPFPLVLQWLRLYTLPIGGTLSLTPSCRD